MAIDMFPIKLTFLFGLTISVFSAGSSGLGLLRKMGLSATKWDYAHPAHVGLSTKGSLNLSSALQLAGYPSVIGTLWQVDDKSSVETVKDVYSGMLLGTNLDPELASRSLHYAIWNLRGRTPHVPGFTRAVPDNPLIWAPYIHLGI